MTTLKQKAFAREFAISGNGTASAVAVGYAPGSAHVQAIRLLRNANVTAAIEAEQARLRAKADLRAEDVLRGLRDIAEDEGAPHVARVSAYKALGDHLGLWKVNPIAEGVSAFLSYLAEGARPAAIEGSVTVLDS